MNAFCSEGVRHRFTHKVSIIIGNSILVAIVIDINIPHHGETLDIIESIDGRTCIQKTGLVGGALHSRRSDDWGGVEDLNDQDFTGMGSVVICDVVDQLVGAASIPRNSEVIANNITVIVSTADIIGIHAGVNIPALDQCFSI